MSDCGDICGNREQCCNHQKTEHAQGKQKGIHGDNQKME